MPAPPAGGADIGGGNGGTAIVFPGIRPMPFAETGKFLLLNPVGRRLTAVADRTLGHSLLDGYRDAAGAFSDDERVSFLVACLALAQWSAEQDEKSAGDAADGFGSPSVCVGASFGGTPAAVYSGALDFESAVWLTARWNESVTEFFAGEYGDVVTLSFARTPRARLAEIRQELDEAGEWHEIACHVDEEFWMLSVRERRLDWLQQRLRASGGLPMYTMSPPMHSPAFAPLRDRIEERLLSRLVFRDPTLPVVSDHDGRLLTTGEEVRQLLLDGIVRTVRWPLAMQALAGRGVARLLVSGPDGLWGRVDCARRFEVRTLTPDLALRPRRRPRRAALT